MRNKTLLFILALLSGVNLYSQTPLYSIASGDNFLVHYPGNMNRCEKGQSITFLADHSITAAAPPITITINGLMAQAIHNTAGANLAANDIRSGQEVTIVYDGVEFQMTSTSGNVTAGAGNGWLTLGNAGTTSGTNFIGTSDNTDVLFKRNNVQSGLLNNALANTSWGVNALNSGPTGTNNTATGFQALFFNAAGSNNTANGFNSLFNNNAGGYNTAFGTQALYTNGAGINNTATGYNAVFSNSAGNYNTGNGYMALFSTTGSNNTALGWEAGMSNGSGSNNTLMGYNANVSSGALTNATAIGANAIVGVSNSLVLGGTGGSAVNVGIGTASPGALLDAAGKFQVDLNGNIIKLNNATTTFPNANATGVLTNNGTGTLTWAIPTTGTVTSFSSGNAAPLFSSSVATPTTTPALSFTLSNAGAHSILGNNTAAPAAPAYITPTLASALFQNQGTVSQVLHGNGAGNPSWSQVSLTTDVSGLLPLVNGGSNASLVPINGGAFYSTATAMAITAAGTSGQVLTSNGTAAPTWNPITGLLSGGTNNYIPKWTSSSTLSSTSLIYDDGTNVGIGTVPAGNGILEVNQTGTINAGYFNINNAANTANAITGITNGAGYAGFFEINNATNNLPSLYATTYGTGDAGTFAINNVANPNPAIYGNTNGTGQAVYGYSTGTSNAGGFQINNAVNNNPALYANTDGTGNAGSFTISNAGSAADALYATTNGTGNAINAGGNVQFSGSLLPGGAIGATGQFLQTAGVVGSPPVWETLIGLLSGGTTNYLPKWTSATALSSNSLIYDDGTSVGIGTTTPSSKLQVVGNADATQFIVQANATQSNTNPLIKLQNSAGTDLMWIGSDNASNTFVGFNSGKVNNAGAGGLSNTFTGGYAGSSNTTGSYNTANGYEAFFFNTTGVNNTANGYGALTSNINGTANTANGSDALHANTSGSKNTVNGYGVLILNTTGSQNTANGMQALNSNVAGSNATAIGYNAMLYANNTATTFTNYNVALGFEALRGSTTASANTGNLNTALGYQTLWSNTTGSSNTAIGMSALNANTTGLNNTANGYGALASNTTGISNTVNGYGALDLNTTGGFNIAIGVSALRFNNGNSNIGMGYNVGFSSSTGSANVFVGDSAGVSNTTGSYNTYLGFQAQGTPALTNATAIGVQASVTASNNMVFGNSSVVGWGFGVAPGAGISAIKVGTGPTNGNGATLLLTGIWTSTSDSTKKHDIKSLPYGLSEVMRLRPVAYKWKGTNQRDIGFIAQEVKLILPEIVYGEEGNMTLSYSQITSVLTKAMQEQQKIIDNLKSDLTLQQKQSLQENKKQEINNVNQQKQIDELKVLVDKLAQRLTVLTEKAEK